MTNASTLELTTHRSAGPADVPAVARILALAFHDDPVFHWCIPNGRRRAEILPAFFELMTEQLLPHREVQVRADGTAAALSVPPGVEATAERDLPAFEERMADILGEDGERTFAITALLDEHHPTEAHRFLWFLAVQPSLQGTGRGSELLRPMLARCDRGGTAAYLDATSEHNRRLYERHGFEAVARRSVDDSPPLFAMWREPAR